MLAIAITAAMAIVLATFLTGSRVTRAASGSIYISPSSVSVLNGNTFAVEVRANATSGNVAQIEISYPSSSLEVVAYSTSGAIFSNQVAPPVMTTGHLSMTTFASGGSAEINGDSLLLSLTFKAKAGSGTGTISPASGTVIYSNGQPSAYPTTGTTVSFTSPPPPSPSAPTISSFSASPSSITVGETSTLQWSVSNSTGCTVSPGGPSNTTQTSWKTPALNSVAVVGYTLSCKNSSTTTPTTRSLQIIVAAASAPKTTTTSTSSTSSSSTTTSSTSNTPTSTTQQTNTTGSVNGAQETKQPVALSPALDPALGLVESNVLIIRDSNGKLVPNAEVTITINKFTKTYKTDENGKVIIAGAPAGKAKLTVKKDGKQIASQDVTLVAGVKDTAEEVKLTKQSFIAQQKILISSAGAILMVFVLVGGVAFYLIRKRRVRSYVPLANNSGFGGMAPQSIIPQSSPTGTIVAPEQPALVQPPAAEPLQYAPPQPDNVTATSDSDPQEAEQPTTLVVHPTEFSSDNNPNALNNQSTTESSNSNSQPPSNPAS